MLILISDQFDPSLPEKLANYGEVTTDTGRLSEADVVLVRSKTKCTKEYMDSASNLKLIIRGGVGTDNIDKEYAKEKGIKVRNTPKSSSIAVAELTFAMMAAVPTRIVEGHMSMMNGEWKKKELKRTELYGKTLCIIGFGKIGFDLDLLFRAAKHFDGVFQKPVEVGRLDFGCSRLGELEQLPGQPGTAVDIGLDVIDFLGVWIVVGRVDAHQRDVALDAA